MQQTRLDDHARSRSIFVATFRTDGDEQELNMTETKRNLDAGPSEEYSLVKRILNRHSQPNKPNIGSPVI